MLAVFLTVLTRENTNTNLVNLDLLVYSCQCFGLVKIKCTKM